MCVCVCVCVHTEGEKKRILQNIVNRKQLEKDYFMTNAFPSTKIVYKNTTIQNIKKLSASREREGVDRQADRVCVCVCGGRER